MWVPKVQVSSRARSRGAMSSTGCTVPSLEASGSSANSEPDSVLASADRMPDRLPTRLNQGGGLSARSTAAEGCFLCTCFAQA